MVKFFEKDSDLNLHELSEGGAVLVNKELDWTSFDVVNKIRSSLRKTLSRKKVKVGHAGTLDPRATGLLIVCFGPATKKIFHFQDLNKEYVGEFYLGGTTPTYDTETEIDKEYPTEHINDQLLMDKTHQFIGKIEQVPPIFSAIKKDGIPMYKRARSGEKVEIKSRQIEIEAFDIIQSKLPLVSFRVKCGKGTYIRSLAYDYGKALDSGGYLQSLCRTKIGDYDVNDSWNVHDLCDKIDAAKNAP